MTSLSAEEILHWNDTTAKQWLILLNQHPEALALPFTFACVCCAEERVSSLVKRFTRAVTISAVVGGFGVVV